MDDIKTNSLDADILTSQDWGFPVPIAYGPGRLVEIPARCRAMGLFNPLIVTDRGSQNLPFIGRLQRVLTDAGLQSDLFVEISPNPRDDEIAAPQGHSELTDLVPDAVVVGHNQPLGRYK